MRRSGWTKWLIVIPAMLGIVLVTYVRYTTDIWGFGAFICQLLCSPFIIVKEYTHPCHNQKHLIRYSRVTVILLLI